MGKLNKRTIQVLTLITGILGVITLIWLVFDYAMYNRLKPLVLQMEDLGRLEKLSEFIWLSYLYMFCFHMLAAGVLVLQMRYIRKIQPVSILAVVVGVFSFLGIFSDWAVLGDIGKEYEVGWDTAGEWKILYVILGIHMIFTLLVTGICAAAMRYLGRSAANSEMPAKDEIVFVVSQYVGIVCGLIGFAWIALAMVAGRGNAKVSVYHSIGTTIMILIPYGMIVSYWLILRLKDKIGEWYDEKQWHDITRAGFFTLLLLIPTLLFYFIAFSLIGEHFPARILWFPFTLFVTLFLFSLLTLIYYRRG